MHANIALILKILPVLIPLMIVQFTLMIAALLHAVKHRSFRFGNLIFWVLIIICVNIIGPVLYFAVGRKED